MNDGRLWVSVRLRHPLMMPDLISSGMGIEPDVVSPVGGQRVTRGGKRLEGCYPETYWAFRLEDRSDANLDDALKSANQWLTSREGFVHDFVRSGGSVEYFVTVEPVDRMAFVLTPALLQDCVRFHATLSVEVLLPFSEDEQ
jgi:hypothetical protein